MGVSVWCVCVCVDVECMWGCGVCTGVGVWYVHPCVGV